jgi:hypothetical protein
VRDNKQITQPDGSALTSSPVIGPDPCGLILFLMATLACLDRVK